MLTPSVTLLRTQSDERLVELARAGQERAFEAIVERYRKPLLRHCRRVLPESRAEDALQQALVSAWTALQYGADVHDLRPWLYRIVHNTSLNALRVKGYDYDELRETLEGLGGPAELAERRALVRDTFAGLAGLPERQREALLAIAVEGRSQEEVADELGLTSGAVRQLVHRARTTLRAAATAVTPWPLVHWLAAAERGSEPVASRVAELVAGSTAAGVSATLAKAGAVAVIAGSAVSAPVVVDELRDGGAGSRAAAAVTRTAERSNSAGPSGGARPAAAVSTTSSGGDDRSGSGDDGGKGRGRGRGRGGDDAGEDGKGRGRGRGRGRGGDDAAATGSGVSGSSGQSGSSSSSSSDDDDGGKGRGRGRGRSGGSSGGDDDPSSSSGSTSGDDDGGKGRGRGRGRGGDDDDASAGATTGATAGSSGGSSSHSGGDDDSHGGSDDSDDSGGSSGSDDSHGGSDDDGVSGFSSGGDSHDDDAVAEASAVVPEADSSGSGGDEDDD